MNIDNFGGARFEVNYMPVQNPQKQMVFVLNAEVDNAPPKPPGGGNPMMRQQEKEKSLEFGATLANDSQLLMARMYNDGRVMGRFHQTFSNKVTIKNMFMSKDDVQLMCEVDLEGRDFFLQFKGVHSPEGVQLGSNYQQSITPCVSLGAEVNHQVDAITHLTFAGRYADTWNKGNAGDFFSAQLSTMGFIVGNYCHKINPYYSLASEFLLTPKQVFGEPTGGLEPSVSIGGLWKYQSFRFQAKMSGNAELSAMLEQQLQPGIAFQLSGAVAHFKNNSSFGVGFRFG